MVTEYGVKPAASSMRPKITKKIQFAATMKDQITAGKNERQADYGEVLCRLQPPLSGANNIGSYKVE